MGKLTKTALAITGGAFGLVAVGLGAIAQLSAAMGEALDHEDSTSEADEEALVAAAMIARTLPLPDYARLLGDIVEGDPSCGLPPWHDAPLGIRMELDTVREQLAARPDPDADSKMMRGE